MSTPRAAMPARAYVPPKLQSPRAAAQPVKPVIRAQGEELSASLRIPSPQELGIGNRTATATEDPIDWSMVERKLDAAGATGFLIEKTTSGYRFAFQAPSGPVTGHGTTRPEAVRNAMAKLTR